MPERQELKPSNLRRITDTIAQFITVPGDASILMIYGQAKMDGVLISRYLNTPKDTVDWIFIGGVLTANRVLMRVASKLMKTTRG